MSVIHSDDPSKEEEAVIRATAAAVGKIAQAYIWIFAGVDRLYFSPLILAFSYFAEKGLTLSLDFSLALSGQVIKGKRLCSKISL